MLVERPLHKNHSDLPDYLRTIPCDEDASSSSCSLSSQRRRPRLWNENPTAPPPPNYDSDSEDEGPDDDESDDDGFHETKRRRLCPPTYLARPTAGGLTLRAHLLPNALLHNNRARSSRTLVSFSSPLVTESRVRPRTDPDDVRALFYSRADERGFREEARRERRLRASGEWDSDAEEEGGAEGSVSETRGEDGTEHALRPTKVAVGASTASACQDLNEVTESSSSESSDEGEGDTESESDDEDGHDEERGGDGKLLL